MSCSSSHLAERECEKTFMLLNDRSLTNPKDGLNNSLNLTNQDFYVLLVDEKTKTTIASLQPIPPSSVLDPLALILPSLPFCGLPRKLRSGTNFVLNVIFTMLIKNYSSQQSHRSRPSEPTVLKNIN